MRSDEDVAWVCAAKVFPSTTVLSNNNGEELRAMERGTLQTLLRAEPPRWEPFDVWYTATGFGETGVASGALGVTLGAGPWSAGMRQPVRVSSCPPTRAASAPPCCWHPRPPERVAGVHES